jgi:hypothetical protein
MNASNDEKQTDDYVIDAAEVRFVRSEESRANMVYRGEARKVGSMAMAFPLSNRDRMIVVRDEEGVEIGVLDDLSGLDAESRQIVAGELERSYFMPRISDILDVKEEHRVETWKVATDRGTRTFEVRNLQRSVRRIGPRRIVILDVDNNRYDIPDWTLLPRRAQKHVDTHV